MNKEADLPNEGSPRRKLLPEFSLRQMLLSVVVFAGVAALAGMAYRGNGIAIGLVVALLLLVIPVSVMALFTLLAQLLTPAHQGPGEFQSPAFGPDELEG